MKYVVAVTLCLIVGCGGVHHVRPVEGEPESPAQPNSSDPKMDPKQEFYRLVWEKATNQPGLYELRHTAQGKNELRLVREPWAQWLKLPRNHLILFYHNGNNGYHLMLWESEVGAVRLVSGAFCRRLQLDPCLRRFWSPELVPLP